MHREVHVGLKGFPHPRTVRTRPNPMISQSVPKSKWNRQEPVREWIMARKQTAVAVCRDFVNPVRQ